MNKIKNLFLKISKFLFKNSEYRCIKRLNKKKNRVSFSCIVDGRTFLEGKNNICDADIRGAKIGVCTFIDSGFFKDALIGRFCSISSNVYVINSTHPLDIVSTYSGFYKSENNLFPSKSTLCVEEHIKTKKGFSVEIGNDVWIGTHVLIKGGITIGDGAVVAMGAVVTKDVPPYSVVAGVPAKVIKYRFDENTIRKLLDIRWWDWNLDEIEEKYKDFENIFTFIGKYEKVKQ